MKKTIGILLSLALMFIGVLIILNIPVITRKGVNYNWSEIKIPLYLKILDFFDRHYNYKELVRNIVIESNTDEDRIMKIFEWTYKNIRKVPEGYPIIDDHVWHIIVRGYGASDQASDVFTTLCNYAGRDAFFCYIFSDDKSSRIPLSFVKLNSRWYVFDPYTGAYFRNNNGDIANINEIRMGNWKLKSLADSITGYPDYKKYIINLPISIKQGLSRANIQSPLRRLIFEFNKMKWNHKDNQ